MTFLNPTFFAAPIHVRHIVWSVSILSYLLIFLRHISQLQVLSYHNQKPPLRPSYPPPAEWLSPQHPLSDTALLHRPQPSSLPLYIFNAQYVSLPLLHQSSQFFSLNSHKTSTFILSSPVAFELANIIPMAVGGTPEPNQPFMEFQFMTYCNVVFHLYVAIFYWITLLGPIYLTYAAK